MSEFASHLHDPSLIEPLRRHPGAFTRQRKLTLSRVLAMMVSGMCTSVQGALDEMSASSHGLTGRLRECSDRAFAKTHRGFSAQVFDRLDVTLLELAGPFI